MRYLKLTIAYDGTAYCGWQIQVGDISIQEKLEESWKKVTGESIRITASGRTDGGVHAEAQVCSLMTQTHLSNRSLVRALNAETPYDISVLAVEDAPTGFHAIRDAVGKTYRYQIQYGRIRDPLRRRFWWHVPRELDVEQMRQGASYLTGKHDFASFQSAGAERNLTVRTVTRLELLHRDPRPLSKGGSSNSLDAQSNSVDTQSSSEHVQSNSEHVQYKSLDFQSNSEHVQSNLVGVPSNSGVQFDSLSPAFVDRDRQMETDWFPTIVITISADGFLYKMVRNIVGSLVRVGEGKEKPAWIGEVLAQCDRRAAGQAAPANGLFLQEVRY
jgi:tRNA pseudouridine38-40 synthase